MALGFTGYGWFVLGLIYSLSGEKEKQFETYRIFFFLSQQQGNGAESPGDLHMPSPCGPAWHTNQGSVRLFWERQLGNMWGFGGQKVSAPLFHSAFGPIKQPQIICPGTAW